MPIRNSDQFNSNPKTEGDFGSEIDSDRIAKLDRPKIALSLILRAMFPGCVVDSGDENRVFYTFTTRQAAAIACLHVRSMRDDLKATAIAAARADGQVLMVRYSQYTGVSLKKG